ncbi:Putative metallo-beta-lactamase, ribonuclease Z/Hydroxyacylglutathione hydrolase [Septoria linicola]|uniref:Metallo-beta-lactamase, ribonuclease Z/Hydroxyacylglutathione hydrolase n=1 Tax=Septoria linicola TaxID=215465 RepID=A0A9Q9EIE4_9PEZI|nr:Putative metallo-beta-lactamase, ribonuclease Z/Hydroxyacylglutathione hydrolase [Septoria linicola]
MTDKAISVRSLPSKNPDHSKAKEHHIGDPPTSFKNPWPSFRDHSKLDVLKLRFGSNTEKNFVPVPEGPGGSRSDELVKVLKPGWGSDQKDKLRATWIGHASWLVETPVESDAERGVRVLFDPVFSERTSPFSFAGPKRYTPTPCSLNELPDPDIVCISHNHYDHLDFFVVNALYEKLKGRLHFFVGLNTSSWFLQYVGCDVTEVTEVDWWDSHEVSIDGVGTVQLTACPTQHFSGRTLFDAGHALWCSYVLEHRDKKLYFAGDTAYQAHDSPSPCPAFAQIGERFASFDLAMIPIGLYSPPVFAAAVHVHPEQSLEIHKAVRSNLSIGMHYGTVRGGLSAVYEPVTDPPRRWREAAEKEGMWRGGGVEGDGSAVDVKGAGGVGLCHVGETVAV